MATNPARRSISPIHCLAGRSSKGVNCTVTGTTVLHNTSIALIDKHASVRPPVFMGLIPIIATESVCRTMASIDGRRSVVIGTTTITSCHPSEVDRRGIGGDSKRVSVRLREASSVLGFLKRRGQTKRFLYKFSVRARGIVSGSETGLTGGGLSVITTGGIGIRNTKFRKSAGILALVARSRRVSLPLVDGRSTTFEVLSGVLSVVVRSSIYWEGEAVGGLRVGGCSFDG